MTGEERQALRQLVSEARARQERKRDIKRRSAQQGATNTGRPAFWTPDAVIAELRHHYHINGYMPTQKHWERRAVPGERRRPSPRTVKKLFGTWNGAVLAAGLVPRQYRRAA